jgi:hypothetical protein
MFTVEDSDTLLDLHEWIQEVVGFDNDHLFEFYTANSASPFAEKHRFFADADDWEEEYEGYAETQLRDIWPLGRKKLYYHFDFGDDWIFEIRKPRSLKSDADLKPGRVLESEGPDPVQYPTEEEWES